MNKLIDQGWQYVPADKGGKCRLIPPDPKKRTRYVAQTPSDVRTRVIWIGQLRRSGAVLDDAEIEKLARHRSRQRLHKSLRAAEAKSVEVDAEVIPLSTRKNRWWAPETQEPEPRVKPRVVPPPSPDDARGTIYSLGQARAMLRQGYHVRKVISKTGWGLNHFKDLIDNTGYIRLVKD